MYVVCVRCSVEYSTKNLVFKIFKLSTDSNRFLCRSRNLNDYSVQTKRDNINIKIDGSAPLTATKFPQQEIHM